MCQSNPSVQSSPGWTTELAGTMQGLPVCLLCTLLCSVAQTQSDSTSRPLVNPEQELTILETCTGVADGTRCTKRCIHWTCDPKFARCYKGNCKRAGHHPCNTVSHHPCCCGTCDKQMVSINLATRPGSKSAIQQVLFRRRTPRIPSVPITSRNWPGIRRRR